MQPLAEQAWPIGSPLIVSVGDINDPLGKLGFKDKLTDTYVNSATGVVDTVRDRDSQVTLTGVTLPISMTYLTASNGVYYGEIPSTALVAVGQKVEVRMTLAVAGKSQPFWLRFYGQLP